MSRERLIRAMSGIDIGLVLEIDYVRFVRTADGRVDAIHMFGDGTWRQSYGSVDEFLDAVRYDEKCGRLIVIGYPDAGLPDKD